MRSKDSFTDQQIAEAEAVCEKATEGPWKFDNDIKFEGKRSLRSNDRVIISLSDEYQGYPENGEDLRMEFDNDADAAFIAASRTGWPLALSALRAAREENERMRKALDSIADLANPCDIQHGDFKPNTGACHVCENLKFCRAFDAALATEAKRGGAVVTAPRIAK